MIKGQTVSKERWEIAINGLKASAPLITNIIARDSPRQSKEASALYLSDVTLAVLAMEYVAEFAIDKVQVMPIEDSDYEEALKELKEIGVIEDADYEEVLKKLKEMGVI